MSKQGATTSKKAPPKAPKTDRKSASVGKAKGTKPSARGKQAKPRSIDTHQDKQEIIDRILRGESQSSIDRAYGFGKGVTWRYVTEILAERVQEAVDRQSEDLEAQIRRIMVRMEKLYDACDAYLQDPNNPEKYDLNPRSWEIEVSYRVMDDVTDKPIMRKESLQRILERMDEVNMEPWEIKHKHADPRKLIIDTAMALTKQLEVIARILGKIKSDGPQTLTVNVNQYMVQVNAVLSRTLEPFPDARAAVIKELKRISAEQPAEG